ncbi:unnamed protein product [Heligmosomoides polygyrus]|uniref:Reverse transcriptase domain-containing protein n=1 Tax=Heligmosomoides polygyrus TaxID=6339 RepID=A0A183FS56_HELPZ|nr:unnamed protein product [Heligmosomoides polygyrus]
MRELEWDDMGVKVDGRQLHHLRFADDIVLITPSISQAERMLADFDRVCGSVGLQLNLTKTIAVTAKWNPKLSAIISLHPSGRSAVFIASVLSALRRTVCDAIKRHKELLTLLDRTERVSPVVPLIIDLLERAPAASPFVPVASSPVVPLIIDLLERAPAASPFVPVACQNGPMDPHTSVLYYRVNAPSPAQKRLSQSYCYCC